MTPLLRLANEIGLAADGKNPARGLSQSLREFEGKIRRAPSKIAFHLVRWLKSRNRPQVITYSYSSTVAYALTCARRHVGCVFCSESRPANEGIKTARVLAAKGIETNFLTDAALFSQISQNQIVLLGADAVLCGWVAAKAGSKALVARAVQLGAPVVFLVDTTKFWPGRSTRYPRWELTFGPDEDLWRNPPRRLKVCNPYIELVPVQARSPIRLLTESGWMTPKHVRRLLKRIPVLPHLASIPH